MRSPAAAPRPLAVAVGLLLAALAILLLPVPATAHAVLVSSSPADGARVATSPPQVRLTFDERVGLVPGASLVLAADGRRVDRGPQRLSADGRSLLVPLQPGLPKGAYTVTWRVISADSHAVSGSTRFGVRQDPASVRTTTPPRSGVEVADTVAGGLVYAGTVLLVGVPAVLLVLRPAMLRGRRARRLVAVGGVVLAASTVLDLLLRGPAASGSDWPGVLRLDGLGAVLATPVGAALLVRLGLLVAAAFLLRLLCARRSGALLTAGAAIGSLLLGTVALLGHAASGPSAVWLVPVAVLHLAATAVWLGGLVVLVAVLLPRRGGSRAAEPLRRVLGAWSRLAFAAVAVLIVTGEVQALRTVAPLESLWTTGYGALLLIKILLVAVALAAATASRRLLGGRTAGGPLRRAIAVEVVVASAVVAVTAALTMEPTALETYGPPVAASVPMGPADLDLSVDSTRRGPTSIHLVVRDGRGRPLDVETVEGSLTTEGVSGLDVTFRRGTGGRWSSTDAQAPLAGRWLLTLQVSVDQAHGYATSASWTVR